MRFVIVTGMSGAGKSTALKMLEDMGYFCVDNLPLMLLPKFAEMLSDPDVTVDKVALGIDIRSGQALDCLEEMLEEIRTKGIDYEILFLDAKSNVLVKRYKETRRFHPLSGSRERVDIGIRKERARLGFLKRRADYLIDTSHMLTRELKRELNKIYIQNKEYKNLYITVLSFGFKYGIPMDSDLVFDVRFLPNPFYIPELKHCTGLQSNVSDYVMSFEQSREFLRKLIDMADYLIPHYIEEGKSQLVIAVGCTGGHHRSVTIAEKLYKHLRENKHHVVVTHRDIEKGV